MSLPAGPERHAGYLPHTTNSVRAAWVVRAPWPDRLGDQPPFGTAYLTGRFSAAAGSRWRDRRPTRGAVVWLVQRVASVLLLILVPLKVISGWAFRGAMPGRDLLSTIHTNGAVDVVLIAAVAFHALFGIRTMMIDSGWVRAADRLTIPFAIVAAFITVWGAAVAL